MSLLLVVHPVVIGVFLVFTLVGHGEELRSNAAFQQVVELGILLDDDLELGAVDDGAALLSSLCLHVAHDCDDDIHQHKHDGESGAKVNDVEDQEGVTAGVYLLEREEAIVAGVAQKHLVQVHEGREDGAVGNVELLVLVEVAEYVLVPSLIGLIAIIVLANDAALHVVEIQCGVEVEDQLVLARGVEQEEEHEADVDDEDDKRHQ